MASTSMVSMSFARCKYVLQPTSLKLGKGNRKLIVVVQSRKRGFATESLEHAVQAINKIIFEQEQKRQRQRALRADGDSKGRVEVEVQPVCKPITFKGSAKSEKLVKEPADLPTDSPRGLSDYLALPLDQYSLLDPGWISRSPAAPDMFVLRLPLFDLVGLDLQPQINVRVSLDPTNNQVHFHADQFKVGDPRFDSDFKLNMRATLRSRPVPTLRPFRSIRRMWSRAGSGAGGSGGREVAAAPRWGRPFGMRTSGAANTDTATGREAPIDVELTSPGHLMTTHHGTTHIDDNVIVDGSDEVGTEVVVEGWDVVAEEGQRGLQQGADIDGEVVVVAGRAGLGTGGSRDAAGSIGLGTATSSSDSVAGTLQYKGRGVATDNSDAGGIGFEDNSSRMSSRNGRSSNNGSMDDDGATNGDRQRAGRGESDMGSSMAAESTNSTSRVAGVRLPSSTLLAAGGKWVHEAPPVSSGRQEASAAAGASVNEWRQDSGGGQARSPGVYDTSSPPAVASSLSSSARAAGSAPFIEDSVLYVPASQWGRQQQEQGLAVEPTAGGQQVSRSDGGGQMPAQHAPARSEPTSSLPPQLAHGHHSSGPTAPGAGERGGEEGLDRPPLAVGNNTASAAHLKSLNVQGGTNGQRGSGGQHHASAEGAVSASPAAGPGQQNETEPMDPTATSSSFTRTPSPAPSTATPAPAPVAAGATTLAPTAAEAPDAGSPHPQSGPSASATTQVPGTGAIVVGSVGSGSGTSAEEGATAQLMGSVDVSVTVTLPPALSAVPRPLLGMTGSLITRYAISSLLPSFLDLLVADYGRWSTGQTVAARAAPVGDLAATAVANATAMGTSAGRSSTQQHAPTASAASASASISAAEGEEVGR